MSSRYRPRPRRNRSSSTRATPAPTYRPRPSAMGLSECRRRRVYDVAVAGAPAQVAGERVGDGLVAADTFVGERRERHHDARGAEAALEPVLLAERGGDGGQRVICAGQAFDGSD